MTSKICVKCKEEKAIEEFYAHPQARDRHCPECKKCSTLIRRESRLKNRDAHNARRRAYYAKNKDRIKRFPSSVNKEKREAWVNSSPRMILGVCLRAALKRHLTANPITIHDLLAIWKKQEGRCALTGLTLTWNKGGIRPTSVSIDRIDNNRGYEIDNIRLVCFAVNVFRGRMNDEELYRIALALVSRMPRPKLRVVS